MAPDLLARAVELQRQCWTHERIAAELGVHRVTVSRALARHNRRALKRLERRAAAIKAQQVRQLEEVAQEAFGAWLHSKTPRILERTKVRGAGDDEPDDDDEPAAETVTETTTHHCSAALLNQVRGALADVRKILGLDAPERIALGADDKPPPRITLPAHDPRTGPGPSAEGGLPPEAGPGVGDAPA